MMKWNKRELTWSISPQGDLLTGCLLECMRYAVEQVERAGVLRFQQVDGATDIYVSVMGLKPGPSGQDAYGRTVEKPGFRWIMLNSAFRWERTVGMSAWERFKRRFTGRVGMEWILLHELLHACGLGHVGDRESIMYEESTPEAMPREGLSEADLYRLRKLYGVWDLIN